MADVILTGFCGGGVTSDDVTATRDKVVQGYTALTMDSDDEVVEGTIEEREEVSEALDYSKNENSLFVAIQEGWYHKFAGRLPKIKLFFSNIISVLGIDFNTILNTQEIAGQRGTIRTVDTSTNNYKGNQQHDPTGCGIDPGRGYFWIDLPHGSAYYTRSDNRPHVTIPSSFLGTADAGCILQGYSATSQNGVKIDGTIPRWINTTGDVISAWNGEWHAWDDTYAGRGRGVITRIPNGYRVENANWVFAPEPNLHSHNIRAGVSMFGLQGTMTDYGAGGMAFGNATFDGRLLSEVAKHPTKNPLWISLQCQKRDGSTHYIRGFQNADNLTLPLRTFHVTEAANRVAYGMSRHSINLTPFRSIRMRGRETHNSLLDGNITAHTSSVVFLTVVRADVVLQNRTLDGSQGMQDGVKFSYALQEATGWERLQSRDFDITLDVSSLHGHHALLISYHVENNNIGHTNRSIYGSSYELHSIEFIN